MKIIAFLSQILCLLPTLHVFPPLIALSLCVVTIVTPILLVKNARVRENK